MITLLLNDFSDTGDNIRESSMTPACFQHVINLLERENEYRLKLWVDKIDADILFQYIDMLETKKIHADIFLGSSAGKDTLDMLTEKEPPLTVDAGCLISAKSETNIKMLKKAFKVNVFLPLPSAQFDPTALNKILQSDLDINEIILGVGWQDLLSGPSKISKQAYGAWSELLLALARILTRNKVPFRFMCGLPLCLFNRKQLGSMSAMLVKWPMAICRESLTIRPDGVLWYCSRIQSSRPINILKEKSITTIRTELNQWLLPFRGFCHIHVDPCRSLHTRACGGGCLADTLSEWQGTKGLDNKFV